MKDRIQKCGGVHDVKIERHQFAAKMQLWIVIQRAADVLIEALLYRPSQNVTQRVKVKMQVQRYLVIQTKTLVVKLAVVHQAATKRDNLAFQAPNEKLDAVWHALAQASKVIFGQVLEL